jgi:hypothetical protein
MNISRIPSLTNDCFHDPLKNSQLSVCRILAVVVSQVVPMR